MRYFGGAFAARSISEKESRTNTYHRDNRKTDSEREREERGKRGARQARTRLPIALVLITDDVLRYSTVN